VKGAATSSTNALAVAHTVAKQLSANAASEQEPQPVDEISKPTQQSAA